MKQFDYVIVGGGSAGCVLAARLSENRNVQVCLLEAGPRDWSPAVHVPLGAAFMLPSRHMNWAFESEPQAGLHGRRSYQPRGRTLGGSSSTNGMVYIRGNAADYDHWAALGNHGWSYEDVLPYFRKSEHNEGFNDTFHGQNGPLNVAAPRQAFQASKAFLDATRALGLPQTADFNGAKQEGFGYYQTTTVNGLRCSAARAFLKGAKERPNLSIVTDAHATRVLFDGRRATGVEYRRGGATLTVGARSEVILSAGTLQSPQLLMLSGIGPEEVLKNAGIGVANHLPGVGRNLQDHIDCCIAYRSKSSDLVGFSVPGTLRLLGEAVRYAATRRGIFASNIAETGGFWRSDPSLAHPDLQFHFVAALLDDHMRKLHWGHGFSIHAYVCRPKSRGFVALKSADPLAPPLIDPNFFAHDDDLETLLRGFKLIRRMAETEPLKQFVASSLKPADMRTDDEMKGFLRQHSDDGYHPVGTCKMGNDEQSVVDARLRVYGVDRLRVVDASIMPTLIAGNTNAATIMIAEKASDLIRDEMLGA
jgi:choline dehydrogenase-like flavoprotein